MPEKATLPGGPPDRSEQIQQILHAAVLEETKRMEANLGKELQSMFGRLQGQHVGQQPDETVRVRMGKSLSCSAAQKDAFSQRRRFTAAADGQECFEAILSSNLDTDSAEERFLRGMEERLEERSSHSTPRTSTSSPASSRRGSRVERSVHFFPEECEEGNSDTEVVGKATDAKATDADAMGAADFDAVDDEPPASISHPHEATAWRADALDFGDRLAASSAAKKGSASVDSIVTLVAAERQRWAEEKQALEARLEELKAQQQRASALKGPDPEKEALRKQLQELREVVKSRSRFGAWVCERHMQESDDEGEEPRNADKEVLRAQLLQLDAEVRVERRRALSLHVT